MTQTNWDLSALFENQEALDKAVEDTKTRSLAFERRYKGSFKRLDAKGFNACVMEYESILQALSRYMTYAFLRFAADSNEGAYYAKYQNHYTDTSAHLLFLELEFNMLPLSWRKNFIAYDAHYAYFLSELAKEKPHQLNLKTESTLIKKEQTGASAFARLFDEHFSTMQFSYNGKNLSEEEILSLLHSADRDTRKHAAKAFTKELKKHQKLLVFIYNMIRRDLRTECEIRNYKSAESVRHIENKITQKSVDALIRACEESFEFVHEYYNKKREILGLDKLYDYDRYAPLEAKEQVFDFEKSRDLVLKTFNNFSPVFGRIAKEAFDGGWIDVYPKPAKRGGAFSHSATPDTHPYILLNHTDQRRDLFTLSHELGHTIHQYLSREAGFLYSDTPLTTAETASVFAEMLVFDEIKSKADRDTKRAMLSAKLEDIFATLYRQINFTTFERAVHKIDGELDAKSFEEIWVKESTKMFGKSVELTSDYSIWWSYIPHFIHTPFYCYAYAYGQLLVLALFGLYKSGEMSDFTDRYIKFLSAGGSKSPKELVGLFGFDIDDEQFWRVGLGEIRKLIDEFKEL